MLKNNNELNYFIVQLYLSFLLFHHLIIVKNNYLKINQKDQVQNL